MIFMNYSDNPGFKRVAWQVSKPGTSPRRYIAYYTLSKEWRAITEGLDSLNVSVLTTAEALRILDAEGYYQLSVIIPLSLSNKIPGGTFEQLRETSKVKTFRTRQLVDK